MANWSDIILIGLIVFGAALILPTLSGLFGGGGGLFGGGGGTGPIPNPIPVIVNVLTGGGGTGGIGGPPTPGQNPAAPPVTLPAPPVLPNPIGTGPAGGSWATGQAGGVASNFFSTAATGFSILGILPGANLVAPLFPGAFSVLLGGGNQPQPAPPAPGGNPIPGTPSNTTDLINRVGQFGH